MSDWSAATEALWRATLASDVSAARRALFQGADPCAERRGPALAPALADESPFARVLMGRPEAGTGRWGIDLDLLNLFLDHEASTLLPSGKTPLAIVVGSRAFNADRAVSCLAVHGAFVGHEYATALLLTMGVTAAPPTHSPYRFATDPTPLLDALWHYMEEGERQALCVQGPKLLLNTWVKLQDRPDLRAVQWLAQQGADVRALPTAEVPRVATGNVVPFRRRHP